MLYLMTAVLDPSYDFVWLDADHPGDDNVKSVIRDSVTSAIVLEAEHCCFGTDSSAATDLANDSNSTPCASNAAAATVDPPPLKKYKSTLFPSYE
jgi:hypothetical protein